MKNDIVKTAALLVLLLAGSGCSGPSGGGSTGDDSDKADTGESNDSTWDKMKWDSDTWS